MRPASGSADFCLISERPIAIHIEELTHNGVDIADGPAHRTGANGPIRSIYVYDPDGNLVEIANQLQEPVEPDLG